MRIWLCENVFDAPDGTTLGDVLRERRLPRFGEAVFLNGRRLGADEWVRTRLREGDEVETAQLVAGG